MNRGKEKAYKELKEEEMRHIINENKELYSEMRQNEKTWKNRVSDIEKEKTDIINNLKSEIRKIKIEVN